MEAQISVEFEEATSRQSLNSGETINTLWSKVKRWLSDLKTVCFSGSYNDLSDKPTTATTDTDGLMSAEDKGKLDSIDDTYALKSLYSDTAINVGREADTSVGLSSTAEGYITTASGLASHAEGYNTTASKTASHAEGAATTASGSNAHAEGGNTTASGDNSHAEGNSNYKVTQLITDFSGNGTTNDDIINAWNTKKFSVAHGKSSHVEGQDNLSLGHYSHAEGLYTVAIGNQAHTSGYYTKALHDNEVAYGKYNQSNSDTLFSIGDGTADDARHNAFEITTTGGKLHDKDIATTDLIPTTLPANGGTAETISDWGVQTVSDANNAPYGFSNTSPDSANAPDTFWATILTVGGIANGYKQQFAFPWGAGRVTKYRVQDNGNWGSWINVADGGNADTVDGKHAGDFAASINPTIIGSIKIMGYSTNTVQSIFPDGDTIRIRNLDSETSQTNNYADIIITTSGVFTEKAVNGVWQGRKELLTSTCVTGTSTIVDSNNFVSANFGFTPSAVLYAVYDSKTGIDDNYRLAHNFNSGGFITETHTAPPIGGGIETFSYIAFR